MIEIRWHGRGGQGAFTASKILGGAALKDGKYAMAFPSFGPERRGAPIQAFTKISDEPIKNRSTIKTCDYIIYLDETLFQLTALEELKENGKIILNTSNVDCYKEYSQIIPIDGNKLAHEILHMPVVNTVLLGAFAGISEIVSVEKVKETLSEFLPKKIVEKNKLIIEIASKMVNGEELLEN